MTALLAGCKCQVTLRRIETQRGYTFPLREGMAAGSMPPHVHGQRPPPALRFRVTPLYHSPASPRRTSKYTSYDPSGRSRCYETQLA